MSHQSQNREILAIKSHQIQWKLMGTHGFSNQISSNPMESQGIHESYGIHEILAFKSHQIQWNPTGSMGTHHC